MIQKCCHCLSFSVSVSFPLPVSHPLEKMNTGKGAAGRSQARVTALEAGSHHPVLVTSKRRTLCGGQHTACWAEGSLHRAGSADSTHGLALESTQSTPEPCFPVVIGGT